MTPPATLESRDDKSVEFTYRIQRLSIFVRDLNLERVLNGHNELDGIKSREMPNLKLT